MNKLLIPTILMATILVAAAFAIMPVEKASTVHSTLAKKGSQTYSSTVNSATGVTNIIADLGAGAVAHFAVTRNISTALTGGTLQVNCIDAAGVSSILMAGSAGPGDTNSDECIGRGVTATVLTATITGGTAQVAAVATIGN